jgi:hypothetical protein
LTGGSIDVTFTSSGYRNDLIEYTSNYVGLNDVEENKINLAYSNSSHELLLTAFGKISNSTIDVYNNLGKKVEQLNTNSDFLQKWPLHLNPGIYHYKFNITPNQIKSGSFTVIN